MRALTAPKSSSADPVGRQPWHELGALLSPHQAPDLLQPRLSAAPGRRRRNESGRKVLCPRPESGDRRRYPERNCMDLFPAPWIPYQAGCKPASCQRKKHTGGAPEIPHGRTEPFSSCSGHNGSHPWRARSKPSCTGRSTRHRPERSLRRASPARQRVHRLRLCA